MKLGPQTIPCPFTERTCFVLHHILHLSGGVLNNIYCNRRMGQEVANPRPLRSPDLSRMVSMCGDTWQLLFIQMNVNNLQQHMRTADIKSATSPPSLKFSTVSAMKWPGMC
jgi:hypothetical protein